MSTTHYRSVARAHRRLLAAALANLPPAELSAFQGPAAESAWARLSEVAGVPAPRSDEARAKVVRLALEFATKEAA